MEEEIVIIAETTDKESNQCDCELEHSTDFYPLILGKDNCANAGDIYFEMPTIKGLTLNPNVGYIENAAIESVFTLEFTLSKEVDRNPTNIDAVPLKFYVLNKGERTD